jgi:hypothetical protein
MATTQHNVQHVFGARTLIWGCYWPGLPIRVDPLRGNKEHPRRRETDSNENVFNYRHQGHDQLPVSRSTL